MKLIVCASVRPCICPRTANRLQLVKPRPGICVGGLSHSAAAAQHGGSGLSVKLLDTWLVTRNPRGSRAPGVTCSIPQNPENVAETVAEYLSPVLHEV